jgi:hypothetical protein
MESISWQVASGQGSSDSRWGARRNADVAQGPGWRRS